ncbi:MAG: fused MFS/spermidine synthase [Candidatus Rokuibacteriota bacterium]
MIRLRDPLNQESPTIPLSFTAILTLFFLSGFSGLIYEVVWLRMLVRAFGSTTFATSTILAVFMFGLAAGAWLGGRRSKSTLVPLRAYALVELALAVAAALATWVCRYLPNLVAALWSEQDAASALVIVVRSSLCFLVLIVPTLLMGASLPLLAQQFSQTRHRGWDRAALLYGVNTVGAVIGVIYSGFLAIGALGEIRTAAIAVAINVAVGAMAFALSRRASTPAGSARPFETPFETPEEALERLDEPDATPLSRRIVWLVALSGFCALALEVVWTRMLVLLLGTSVYAFSAMLSCFLVGIGLGSLVCARWTVPVRLRGSIFGALQVAAGLLAAATLELYLSQGMVRLGDEYLYSPIQSASDFLALFGLSAGIIIPVTLLYGMMFPLAIRIADSRAAGTSVGTIYAFNTAGSVLGSLACGFVLIPALGTRNTLYLVCLVHIGLGLATAFLDRATLMKKVAFAALIPVVALPFVRPDPFFEIVQARLMQRNPGKVIFHEEGSSATVTGYASRNETLLVINGVIVSGIGALGTLMADIPLLLQDRPERALVICLGTGNTFRAAVEYNVAVDLVELEPEVIASFSKLWPDSHRYTERPGARLIVNDGRNFLLTSTSKYDAIVVDGSPPIYSAGTVNLFTREFVELAKAHLTPTGVFALWVPLPSFESDFWMIAKNMTDTFPHTLAWAEPRSLLRGFLLLGSNAPLGTDPAVITQRMIDRKRMNRNPWLNERLFAPWRLISDARLREKSSLYPNVTDEWPYTEFPLPAFLEGAPLLLDSAFAFR